LPTVVPPESAATCGTSKSSSRNSNTVMKIYREEDRYAVNQKEKVEKVKEGRKKKMVSSEFEKNFFDFFDFAVKNSCSQHYY
jgi:hypothetical protein